MPKKLSWLRQPLHTRQLCVCVFGALSRRMHGCDFEWREERKKNTQRFVSRARELRVGKEVKPFKVFFFYIFISLSSGNSRDKHFFSPFTFPLQFCAHSGNCRTWTGFKWGSLYGSFAVLILRVPSIRKSELLIDWLWLIVGSIVKDSPAVRSAVNQTPAT